MSSDPRAIALVTPWFGAELKGGAEQQAWQTATRLAARGHVVEVLTTCSRAFQDNWATNHYPPGSSRQDYQEQGMLVRRFPLRRSTFHDFNALNGHLLRLERDMLKPGVSPVPGHAAEFFASDNINSPALMRHLQRHGQEYAAILFLPYLYGPILNGLPLVADRACLMPCLHDEAYAYLPPVERIFRQARRILYLSAGEKALAERLYGPGIVTKGVLVGAGVELTASADRPESETGPPGLGQKFVLCLGRRDVHKNTNFLVQAFAAFRQHYPQSSLQLVLAGPGETSYSRPGLDVLDLGLISEADKAFLLSRCQALFQPSQNESYSRVIMEAWFCGRPVAAHAGCLATATVVQDSKGGWLAQSLEQWRDLFAMVDQAAPENLDALGRLGMTYAQEHATWERVLDRYEAALGLRSGAEGAQPAGPKSGPKARADAASGPGPLLSMPRQASGFDLGKGRAMHQIVAGFRLGDAISNYALAIREQLRLHGFASDIFLPGQHLDPAARHMAKPYSDGCIKGEDGLIYHHSIGSDLTPFAAAHRGPKCLIYHNITPAHFFERYSDSRTRLLEAGRHELAGLASSFTVSIGDSAYNARELAEAGFQNPEVVPLIVDPSPWNAPPDPVLMARFQDGRTNLLFVGRIAPNKRQDRLIRAFAAYRRLDPHARLILVGGFDPADPFYISLTWMKDKFGLGDNVLFLGSIPDPGLQSCYRTAHLYWSMSEHEGFGVPLIEAMWFDIPVLAYESSAVPETLGGAGALFRGEDDYPRLAGLARMLVTDGEVRRAVIAGQKSRRADFLASRFTQRFQHTLERMGVFDHQP